MTSSFPDSLFDALPVGVLVLDPSGAVLAANRDARRLLAQEADRLVGRRLFEDLPALRGASSALAPFRSGMEREDLDLVLDVAPDGQGPGLRVHLRSFRAGDERRAVALVRELAGQAAPTRLARAVEISSRVKHDVNNLLMGLLGHTALLRAREDLEEELQRRLVIIDQQGQKIRDRIAGLDAVKRLEGDDA